MSRNVSHQHLIAALILLVALAGTASAVPPQSISYQAYLKDSVGLPVTTTQSITFRIYDAVSGGTPLWSDTLSVPVTDGLFSVELGTIGNPLPKASFGNPLWLGVEIGADGEAVPRNPLNAAGNAFRSEDADTVGGMAPIDLDQSADVATNTANIATNTGSIASNITSISGMSTDITTNTSNISNTIGNLTAHEGDVSAHHAKTTSFAEITTGQVASGQITNGAITDAKITGPIASSKIDSAGLDADTIDGLHANAFMSAGADNWVNIAGDTMSGDLLISNGNNLGVGITPLFPLHVSGDVKFGPKINFGSTEFIEDGGTDTISTGSNALSIGGTLTVTGQTNVDGGLHFPDSSIQTTAAGQEANRVVVAASGGDFSSIQAAIDSVTPTVTSPVVIDVMPGMYTEHVKMKSYMHLRGAGVDTTMIYPPDNMSGSTSDKDLSAITMDSLTSVEVSGLTVYGGDIDLGDTPTAVLGIYDDGSSPIIQNVTVRAFTVGGYVLSGTGIYSINSSPIIRNSEISSNGERGILIEQGTRVQITGNRLIGNIGNLPDYCAITVIRSEAMVNGNYLEENGAPICAIGNLTTESQVSVTGNQLVENYSGIFFDGQVKGQIVGNQIQTTSGGGYGIVGGDMAFGTSIVGNQLIGTEYGISAPTQAAIVGNQIEVTCAGGCPSNVIYDPTEESRISGNSDNTTGSSGLPDHAETLYLETLGIGTTTPSYKLQVAGNSSNYLASFYNDASSTSLNSKGIDVLADSNGPGTASATASRFIAKGGADGGSAYGSFLWSNAYGTSNSYGVYSDATPGTTSGREYAFYGRGDGYFSQNLGIGTSTPSHKLEVSGNESSYIGHFANNTVSTNSYVIRAEANASNANFAAAIGVSVNAQGGYGGGPTIGSENFVSANGSSAAYGVYSDAVGGSTTGREYAFYGVGEGYFSKRLGIGSNGFPTGTDVLIEGTGSAGDNADLLIRESGSSWGFNFGVTGTSSSTAKMYIAKSDGTTFNDVLILTGGNNVGIARTPTANRLEVDGNASKSTSGTWLSNSDAAIKTAVEDVPDALEILGRVRPVRFRYTPEYLASHPEINDEVYYNVIAQEFAEVFPDAVQGSGELVPSGEREILQVDVHPALMTTIAAVQELNANLQEMNAQLEAENAAIKNELAVIRSMLKNR